MLRFWKSESGVAMVTVLFVGAALTAVVSAASFVTLQQFQSGLNDRKAATALGYAEAGIDRLVQYVRGGSVSWNQVSHAGCSYVGATRYLTTSGMVDSASAAPVETIGSGTYQAYLTVYNINSSDPVNQFPPGACSDSSVANASPHDPHYFVITSTGRSPVAKRVVRQVVKISPKGFPIGLYASAVNAGGTPGIVGDSLVTTGKVVGREKLAFTGCDPYYQLSDFWPSVTFPSGTRCYPQVPSSAHALGGIFLKQNGTQAEFSGGANEINCSANDGFAPSGTPPSQSLWDSDGLNGGTFPAGTSSTCNGLSGSPGTSKLDASDLGPGGRLTPQPALTPEDYDILKQAAKASGIFCTGATAQSCTVNGNSVPAPNVWQDGDIAPILNSGTLNFVAYFDFTAGTAGANSNTISWKANVQPVGATPGMMCSTDPTKNRSVIIIVHNGSFSLEGAGGGQPGNVINGAIIMDGDGAQFKYTGSPTFDGPIIMSGSNSTLNMGGGPTFALDSCWVQNMPVVMSNVTPVHWSEIDR